MLVYYVGYGYFADFSEQIERDFDGHLAARTTLRFYKGVFEIEKNIVEELEYTGTAPISYLELTEHKGAVQVRSGHLKNFLAERFKQPSFWMIDQHHKRIFVELKKGEQHYYPDAMTKLSILDAPQTQQTMNQKILGRVMDKNYKNYRVEFDGFGIENTYMFLTLDRQRRDHLRKQNPLVQDPDCREVTGEFFLTIADAKKLDKFGSAEIYYLIIPDSYTENYPDSYSDYCHAAIELNAPWYAKGKKLLQMKPRHAVI